MKGLVSLKKALCKSSPVIPDGPVRDPVNKQAALIVRPAHWLSKPLPSDPDLSDRQVVLQFLRERANMNQMIQALKVQSKDLKTTIRKQEHQIAELKAAIADAQANNKTTVKMETPKIPEPKPRFDVIGYSSSQLKDMVRELISQRTRLTSCSHWSLKFDMTLRDLTEACERELAKRGSE